MICKLIFLGELKIKLRLFLEYLILPLFVLMLIFSATTFLAYYVQQANWQQEVVNWQRVLELFDLREENTLATWFSGVLFLFASISFILLGWGQSASYILSHIQSFGLKIIALALCLLSADEIASVHETVGSWFERKVIAWDGVHGMGFSWVILFGPLFIAILIWCVMIIINLIKQLDEQKSQAGILLLIASISLPGVLLLELYQGYLVYTGQGQTILTCVEEMLEMLGIYSLFLIALIIARQHQL